MSAPIGKTVEYRRIFTAEDVAAFSHLTEDNNPIHLDAEYAAGTIFKQRVVHGIFLAGMFSRIFGTVYPGKGGIYIRQDLKFTRPAFLEQEVRAVATLTAFDEEKRRGIFKTECFDPAGKLLVTGEAELLFPGS